MTNVNKKRRPPGERPPPDGANGSTKSTAGAPPRTRSKTATATRTSSGRKARSATDTAGRGRSTAARRDQREPDRAPVVQPPIGVSLSRGLSTVGGSPLLLVSAFLADLLLWLGVVAYGVQAIASPATMVQLISLPPFRSFIDLRFLAAGRLAILLVVAVGGGLMALRALLATFWIAVMVERLGPDQGRPEGGLAAAVGRRMRRAFLPVFEMELAFIGVFVFALVLLPQLLGQQFGLLAWIGWLLAGLFFFVYAQITAVADGSSFRDALRLSIRASRLPGREHAILVFAYMLLTIFLIVATPSAGVVKATPPLSVWIFVLFVGFVDLGVLAAFVYRWLAIGGAVREAVASGERPARRPSMFSVFGSQGRTTGR